MPSRFTNKKTVEWMKNTIMNGVNIISYAYIYIYIYIYIYVPRPLLNDLWVFLFQTIDAEYVKWASPGRTYVYVKAFIVKAFIENLFLVQHINIVKRVMLKSFWLICSCLSYTQRKDSSNNHLHTLSSKLIIVRFWPLKDQTLEEST